MFTDNNIILKQAGSTNSYALQLKSTAVFKEGLVVTADFQTGGKGQRGKEWESNRGENLLLSAVIESNISIDNQFDFADELKRMEMDMLEVQIKKMQNKKLE